MSNQLSFDWLPAAPARTDVLFFAIRPEAAAASSLTGLACRLRDEHGLRGKPLATDCLHISLLGLGEYAGVPQGIVAAACEAAMIVAASQFDFTFDRVASFGGKKGNLPLVLYGGDGVAALMAFRKVLAAAMMKVGLVRAQSRFSPHLTLLYGDRKVAEHPVAPVSWTVREFALVHSLYGQSRHIPLERWPLRG
jgi:2'-5' RNA ligase